VVGWGYGQLICVELKVRDWRQAIVQASICQLCTPQVYVALPHNLAQKVNRQPFLEFGIGLLAVDGTAEVVVDPVDLGLVDSKVRKRLEHRLRHYTTAGATLWPGA
jgi:hypothetical protein